MLLWFFQAMPECSVEDNTGQRSDPDKQFGCSPSPREGSKFISADMWMLCFSPSSYLLRHSL